MRKYADNLIIRLVLAFSLAAFGVLELHSPQYNPVAEISITIVVGAVVGYFIAPFIKDYLMDFVKKYIGASVIIALFGIYYVYHLHFVQATREGNLLGISNRFLRLGIYALGVPAATVFFLCVYRFLFDTFKNVWGEMSEQTRKEYKIANVCYMFFLCITYTVTTAWWDLYDVIFSTDSADILNTLFGFPYYYEIAHPFMSMFTGSVGAVAKLLTDLFVPIHFYNAGLGLVTQIFNLQAVLFIGMIVAVLSEEKYMFRFYMCTAPVVFYAVSLEKYQLETLGLVLYIYYYVKKQGSKEAAASVVSSVGLVGTSAFIGVTELFVKNPWKEKVRYILQIFLGFFCALVISGKAFVFWEAGFRLTQAKDGARMGIPLGNAIIVVINFIKTNFLFLDSSLSRDWIRWMYLTEKTDAVAIIIFAIVLLGVGAGWKKTFYKVCSWWLVFAFILFAGFQWIDAPLFNLYFSWAIVPLFLKGFQTIMEKLRVNTGVAVTVVAAGMLILNSETIRLITYIFQP